MDIKISVIVPVHNAEKFLVKCIDSIIGQTLKSIEIICINDGSTDNSLRILQTYAEKDNRILIINQENEGVGAARNNAMDIARGEFIGFIDADDWIDVDYFEKLYTAAKKNDADIACCSIDRWYSPNKSKTKLNIPEEVITTLKQSKFKITGLLNGRAYAVSKIYRKSELQKFNIRFPKGVYYEDTAFSIRAMYYLKTLITVPGIKYYYRVNHHSITRTTTDKKRQDMINARMDLINFTKKHYIQCDEKYYMINKIIHKFCGIPVIIVYKWETLKKYYLFGIIKIWEKIITT